MAPDKSLAAEIEAGLEECNIDTSRGRMGSVTVNAETASQEIATRIQSHAFEDGERAMRQRAEDVARAWMMPKLSATAQDFLSEQHIAERRVRNEAVIGIAAAIAALQPEGERNA